MDPTTISYIEKYCDAMGKKALFPIAALCGLDILFAPASRMVVSNNKLLRAIARIRRLDRIRLSEAENASIQFFALQDAFALLAQKGIPVYFYNRIGKEKSGFQYTEKERYRMKEGHSFPLMYQNIEKYENELRDVFGDKYSKEYVRAIGKIPQVIKVGSIYQHEDCYSEYVNVENGKRLTTNQPDRYTRTIHVYGRCGVFGYAVEDKDTMPSCLQKALYENGITDIRVVNHGLWGGNDECLDHNFLQEAVGFKQGDIVLFYRKHFDKRLLSGFEKRGVRYKEITDQWHARKKDNVTFYDRPGHMNAEGYELVAKIICEDLINSGFSCGDFDPGIKQGTAEHLNYYLKTRTNNDLEKEIQDYIDIICKEYPLDPSMLLNGAIVMNCNPFTKGHRYLIETAAKQVDRLYIFVVEEDKSFFRFNDRLEMVKRGTEDIRNVVVAPSGKFIISAFTFPEYFMKDYVKEKSFDVSMDVETFCKHIAPSLNIKKRFAGEEPFDPVTKNYNESMERILPKYDMQFVEIPRFAIDSERVINATKVRELLKNKEFDELKAYIPQSTYDVLMEKYVD